ncbi:adenosylcobinamide-phosphate synthase CbiB [uncultured Hyphomonas sp.]|uniref:adenosylcobinamide-phosphate synthase CbiB n=1 Tax=uncultured Hyphomonas sp. TaxID=225298 RepID=UPI002AAAF8B1|nr:adenosylcobinamide-phosphate synthase CbiB [uncultured Hyphomonas sp.]
MSTALLMLAAWAIEALFGWPDWLFRLVRHPVVWFGAVVRWLERRLNREHWSHAARYVGGAVASLLAISLATGLAWMTSRTLANTGAALVLEAMIASSLLASRSLYEHVAKVARPLASGDIESARRSVSLIVGRDPARLDEAGIARASIESLAENTSDGVVAPLCWGAIFGLPGLVAYKAINTLDSMIGHRSSRYAAFGGFAARLDDLMNFLPARMTGLMIAAVSGQKRGFKVMFRDASRHRSPNAGWPEAAMAGALGIRLSGPRIYGDRTSPEPWLNGAASDPSPGHVTRGLRLYVRAMALCAALLGLVSVIVGLS